MNDPRRPCHLIQEDMAWARGLSQEDQEHVLSCSACSEIAARFEELDARVRSAMGAEVPNGFADRVVEKIEAEKRTRDSLVVRGRPFLETIFFSRAVQWALVGIGSVLGLFKILRFFAGVVIHASL
jgi:anti-sigma factor RsiW